jgi:HEAT repeats
VRGAIAGLCAAVVLLGAVEVCADVVADEAKQLASASSYKRRLAAVLSLAKSHDERAVRALVAGLQRDKEAQIRRLVALALSKAVDASTPVAARDEALAALDQAASDRDSKVRELAAKAREHVALLRPPPAAGTPVPGTSASVPSAGSLPTVYVHLGDGVDLSSKAPRGAVAKLVKTVKDTVVRKAPGVSTEWPGSPPTEQQLRAAGARGFVVAPTISELTIRKKGSVAVRVAPWSGTDGSEKWTAQKAASASGSGKVISSGDNASVAGAMRDCVLAVGEEVTAKQVVPFLRKIIGDS